MKKFKLAAAIVALSLFNQRCGYAGAGIGQLVRQYDAAIDRDGRKQWFLPCSSAGVDLRSARLRSSERPAARNSSFTFIDRFQVGSRRQGRLNSR